MGAQADWNDYGSVWVEGIFGRADGRYGNWIAKLNSPLLSVKTESEQIQSKLFPNPAIDIVEFEFTISKTETASFNIYDMWGRKVDQILSTRCKQGLNRLQFNVSSLASGNYILTGTTGSGEEIIRTQFIKQ
jgi:hypothetical protein